LEVNNLKLRVLHIGAHEELLMNYYRHFTSKNVIFDFVLRKNGVDFHFKNDPLFNGKLFYLTPLQTSKIKFIFELREIIKSGKYKFVHFHIGYSSIFGILACLNLKVKIICHNHTNYKSRNVISKLARFTSKIIIYNFSDYNFACSEKSGIEMFFGKYTIFPNAIDYEKFYFSNTLRNEIRSQYNINESEIVYGHVGNFYAPKNQKFLASVFKELVKIQPNAKLIFVGSDYGNQNEVIEYVSQCNLQDKILFLGSRSDVNQILNAFDYFLFPSLYEGFGMALLEAQVNGLPCLYSENIPDEAIISKFSILTNLKNGVSDWLSNILKINLISTDIISRLQRSKKIDQKYNVRIEAKNLERFYIEN